MFGFIIRDLITNEIFEYPCSDAPSGGARYERLIRDLYRMHNISEKNEVYSMFETPLCGYLPYDGLKTEAYRLIGFVDYGDTSSFTLTNGEEHVTYKRVLFHAEFMVEPEYIGSLKILHLRKFDSIDISSMYPISSAKPFTCRDMKALVRLSEMDDMRASSLMPKATKCIFDGHATIVFWDDGTKTVVKCQKEDYWDKYSEEAGVALCFMKKMLGNKGNFNNTLNELVDDGIKHRAKKK